VKPLLILVAVFIYLVSINPTAELLLNPLERQYSLPSIDEIRQCNAYIILGGGTNEDAPAIDGKGVPEGDALARVIAGYRLYLIFQKPIIVSGGGSPGHEPSAVTMKRFLVSLGVNEKHIYTESRSRDTYENARYTKELCGETQFRRVLLITSAYHMRRSMMLFGKFFKDVTPYPTGFRANKTYHAVQFLPDARNMDNVEVAIKEYLGILFYTVTL
jgi:uncharacterized SAM-binding protein YcdF (DUF218 family)